MAVLRGDIKQRDLEAFEERYNEYGIDEIKGASRVAGKLVQAAIEAGWIAELEVDDIADMDGKDVRELSDRVIRMYYGMGEVDPNL